jgi:hypothetical protein
MSLVVEVKSAVLRTRELEGGRKLHLQKMALLQDNDFPVVFEAVVDQAYTPGRYAYVPTFRSSRFGSLELNPYELNLEPLK